MEKLTILKQLQQTQLEILQAFDKVCRKHNIKYQLAYGTLLGAIRHQGFIPWDDDLDVMMLRSEYNKFIKIGQKELGSNYFFQNHLTDKGFPFIFGKVRKNNTLQEEHITNHLKMHKGIFIDIFPIDNVVSNKKKKQRQRRKMLTLRMMNSSRFKLSKVTSVKDFLVNSVHFLLKIFSVLPSGFYTKKINKEAQKYNNINTKEVGQLFGAKKNKFDQHVFLRSSLEHSVDVLFEGQLFPVSRQYKDMLTKMYGNYLELPPVKDQGPSHDVTKLSFNMKEFYNNKDLQ